ncbi:alkaline phosphatase D family protein [Haliea sp. E17]|uniref:alkaline phosphatase D family protein n=1 Tax=Haliea sp. E17 TaxID=3401576 RepID=UPI003AB0EF33
MQDPSGKFTRRSIVRGISAAALLPLLSANLTGCSDSNNRDKGVAASFEHGVASGDPLTDRVILWTRATPEEEGAVLLDWEIALDEAFAEVVASGRGETTADVDYTFKVDADGLDAGTAYFYRFRCREVESPIGRTRTAPAGSVPAATFAVVSCANFPAGYFNVYREVAGREVDAVLHLGDYIYEYGADSYASEQAEAIGRVSDPAHEIITLADYRRRYAQYRGDGDLQACHARHPFILVWDDHEIADNTWREGAANHDPATEGAFSERRAAAIQAWYEWLPVRPPAEAREIIYRRFSYGDLLDLLMLDTRNIGRDLQLDYADFTNGDLIDVEALRAAVNDSNRSMLGAEQLAWLEGALTESTARWQVLGQQVLMARLALPEPIISGLNSGALGAATSALLAAVSAKNTPEEQRSAEQQALLDSAIPLNLDAWDGYAFEREALLQHAAQLASRLVVLAGDTHNAWGSQLTTAAGDIVGVEIAAPSVTSPGAEAAIGATNAALFGSVVTTLVDDLGYANLINRGYLEVGFAPEALEARWRFVDTIDSVDYSIDAAAEKVVSVQRSDLVLN